MEIEAKLRHLEGEQGFKFRPSVQVFDPAWHIFELD